MTDDFYLYLQIQGGGPPDTVLGRLMIRGVQQESAASRLRLDVEFFQEDNARLLPELDVPQPRWIDLRAAIRLNQTPQYKVGEVEIQLYDQPAFKPVPLNARTRVGWIWKLWPEDVERIEQARSLQPASPLILSIEVAGSVQLRDGVYGFAGSSGSLNIATSDWETLLTSMGYTLGPSRLALVGGATRDAAAWHEAERRLEEARRHLRAGRDYEALVACLGELEGVVTGPYTEQSWKEIVDGFPEQKGGSIARWFSGFATYLNRVGHHKDREQRDVQGDLLQMPLDHWEAELAVASAHFVLAYALQLR
jgi:hypothetical protein